ncbi:hypothetical protein K469DRAFT_709933 [Zopfia rhizophila CBS 207.26]|uniref:Uncharacterized protein n=1 Tax=Zopfia rhizophila CBS 207.26 TaxID=1314779 RepID=A0A6A6E064_9PEZI|nr:hypothetical protein K469DRAFT_709933 [Zopfia rhizophila CBS 207.26]
MSDIGFRETREFMGLDGQSVPREELLEGVFRQARFDTRFYEEIRYYEEEGGAVKGGLWAEAALETSKEVLVLDRTGEIPDISCTLTIAGNG